MRIGISMEWNRDGLEFTWIGFSLYPKHTLSSPIQPFNNLALRPNCTAMPVFLFDHFIVAHVDVRSSTRSIKHPKGKKFSNQWNLPRKNALIPDDKIQGIYHKKSEKELKKKRI
jgi:hypothetical protein